MKTCSTTFLAIVIMITLLLIEMQHKKQPNVAGNLDDASQPLELLVNILLLHR